VPKAAPLAGSAAIGAATGSVAYRDLSGAVRPSPTSLGAWEVD
jgi:hypothetical protein